MLKSRLKYQTRRQTHHGSAGHFRNTQRNSLLEKPEERITGTCFCQYAVRLRSKGERRIKNAYSQY